MDLFLLILVTFLLLLASPVGSNLGSKTTCMRTVATEPIESNLDSKTTCMRTVATEPSVTTLDSGPVGD